MEYIDTIVKQIISNFDFAFMFTVNALTFLFIKIYDKLNGQKVVPKWHKKAILVSVSIMVGGIYKVAGYESNIVIINSCILAPLFWDWILKPILGKFNIEYKSFDDTMN